MTVKPRKEQPTQNDPPADSPTRFLPAFKRFMAAIEWPAGNANDAAPLDPGKTRMKLEPRPSSHQPK